MEEKIKPITLRLDPEFYRELKSLADFQKRDLANEIYLILELFRDYPDTEDYLKFENSILKQIAEEQENDHR